MSKNKVGQERKGKKKGNEGKARKSRSRNFQSFVRENEF